MGPSQHARVWPRVRSECTCTVEIGYVSSIPQTDNQNPKTEANVIFDIMLLVSSLPIILSCQELNCDHEAGKQEAWWPPCCLPCCFEHAHKEKMWVRVYSSTTIFLYSKQVRRPMFYGCCEWFWKFIIFEALRRLRFLQVLKTATFIVKICKMWLIYDSTLWLPVKHYNNDTQTAFNLLCAIIELEEKSNS